MIKRQLNWITPKTFDDGVFKSPLLTYSRRKEGFVTNITIVLFGYGFYFTSWKELDKLMQTVSNKSL